MNPIFWTPERITHAYNIETIHQLITFFLCALCSVTVWSFIYRQYARTYNRFYIVLWPGAPWFTSYVVWQCSQYLLYYGLKVGIHGKDISIPPVMPSTCEAALQVPGRDKAILPCRLERIQRMIQIRNNDGDWTALWLPSMTFDLVFVGGFIIFFLWLGYGFAVRDHFWPRCRHCQQKKPVTAFVPPSQGGDKSCQQCRDMGLGGKGAASEDV